MEKQLLVLLRYHDGLQNTLGRFFAWGVLSLVLITALVVVLRYGFDTGSIALQEAITYNHAILFMLGISYTYLHDEHVRVDVFYTNYSAKKKYWVNLLGSVLFTLPVAIFLLWGSFDYVANSWAIREGSAEAGGLGYTYLLKSLILIMAGLLLLQALAIIGKNALALKALSFPEFSPIQGGPR
ncbi:MAG: TRAP transporter small permease subunit [Thiotrichales bacterium]|nr:TRAP transporter small permease subunit [Thiotrichales bacterium]